MQRMLRLPTAWCYLDIPDGLLIPLNEANREETTKSFFW